LSHPTSASLSSHNLTRRRKAATESESSADDVFAQRHLTRSCLINQPQRIFALVEMNFGTHHFVLTSSLVVCQSRSDVSRAWWLSIRWREVRKRKEMAAFKDHIVTAD